MIVIDEVRHMFDSMMVCQYEHGVIRLQDGRYVQITGWRETVPPQAKTWRFINPDNPFVYNSSAGNVVTTTIEEIKNTIFNVHTSMVNV